jgi:hypothetical protein
MGRNLLPKLTAIQLGNKLILLNPNVPYSLCKAFHFSYPQPDKFTSYVYSQPIHEEHFQYYCLPYAQVFQLDRKIVF